MLHNLIRLFDKSGMLEVRKFLCVLHLPLAQVYTA